MKEKLFAEGRASRLLRTCWSGWCRRRPGKGQHKVNMKNREQEELPDGDLRQGGRVEGVSSECVTERQSR